MVCSFKQKIDFCFCSGLKHVAFVLSQLAAHYADIAPKTRKYSLESNKSLKQLHSSALWMSVQPVQFIRAYALEWAKVTFQATTNLNLYTLIQIESCGLAWICKHMSRTCHLHNSTCLYRWNIAPPWTQTAQSFNPIDVSPHLSCLIDQFKLKSYEEP